MFSKNIYWKIHILVGFEYKNMTILTYLTPLSSLSRAELFHPNVTNKSMDEVCVEG